MAAGTENGALFQKGLALASELIVIALLRWLMPQPFLNRSSQLWVTCQQCLRCRQLRLSLKSLFPMTGFLPLFSLQMMESVATALSVVSSSTAQQEDKGCAKVRYGKGVSIFSTIKVSTAAVDLQNFSPDPSLRVRSFPSSQYAIRFARSRTIRRIDLLSRGSRAL